MSALSAQQTFTPHTSAVPRANGCLAPMAHGDCVAAKVGIAVSALDLKAH